MRLQILPLLIFTVLFGFCIATTDIPAQPVNNKPRTIQSYSASGNLTATVNFSYDSANRIIRIEDLPGDGVRNTYSDIRYNASGKPIYVETFYSGIKEGAEGITYYRNIQYSGDRISSIRHTSTSDEPATSNYTYYSSTRTYEAVFPDLPVALFQFTPDLNLDRHYTADGSPLFDVTYSTDPGLFVYTSIPIELSVLFTSARYLFFSKNEVTEIPILNGNSYEIDSFRDEYDRIVTIQARTPGTENIVFRLEVSY